MTLKLTYAGFNYVADIDGSYTTSSLSTMVSQTGANSVALTADYGIDAATNTVYADNSAGNSTGSTESIAGITAQAEAAKAAGLSVIIRPLVDFLPDASTATLTGNGNTYADSDWRAYYNPGTVAQGIAFLQSYEQTVLLPLAAVAQEVGAQIFDLGTEIDQLTGPAYQAEWTQIISDVKAVYTGQLTYSAIGNDDTSTWQYANFADGNITNPPPAGTGDITTQVSFWNQLDDVGIDSYSALSNLNDTALNGSQPTLQQLINGWEQPFTDDGQGTPTDATADQTGGLSLIQYYEGIATATGKPLLFTELGYNSAPDAASHPFFTSSNSYDPALQAELYQAFFQAWAAQGNTALQGAWFWNWEPDPATVGAGTDPSWTPQGNTTALADTKAAFTAAETAPCFCAGTLILTDRGEVAVEDLMIGATVLTAAGEARPIQWIGHRTVACRNHPDQPAVWPIRVAAGAFGGAQPRRDLYLSPDHAVFAGGVLIPIKTLVNGATIAQLPRDTVTYWHIELETHDVLLAEGLPCESYLDNGSRGAFANGGTIVQLHPDFTAAERCEAVGEAAACAPQRIAGAEFTAVDTALREHAAALGYPVAAAIRSAVPFPVSPDLADLLQPEWYRAQYPDVAAAGVDPAQHFRNHGRAEGRLPCPEPALIGGLGLIDPATVMRTMPDVAASGADLAEHFCHHGWREGRRPNAYFDPAWYRRTHDLPTDINPLTHYLLLGEPAGLPPSRHFDPAWYRQHHGLAASVCALAHYLRHRRTQRVSPRADFDVAAYVRMAAPSLRPGRDPYAHFLAGFGASRAA